jgi:hypothetical protein
MRASGAAKGEKFGQDLFDRIEPNSREGLAERHNALVPLIAGIGKRNQIKRINEEPSHAGRLGRP